jgi:exosortase/archaeosortase family protein
MTTAPLAQPSTDSIRRFLTHAVLWNVALFGLIRWSWVDTHAVAALISFQQRLLTWYGATPHPGVIVTSDCSGADVMALMAGVLFAYPVRWSRRLIGAAIGFILLLTLNAIRIGSLYAVASDYARLNVWHVYLWPAILTAVTVAYVIAWIWWADSRERAGGRWMRFGVLTGVGLLVYAAIVPWAFTSALLHDVGVWTAGAAAFVMQPFATGVRAQGQLLVTDRGLFQVTQECLFTPMLPIYVAAVASVRWSLQRRLGALALMLPVFFALGVARVLVLAMPASIVESPVAVAHGFYQLMAGALVIVAAAHLAVSQRGGAAASRRTVAALAFAIGSAIAFGHVWTQGLLQVASAAPASIATIDPQGAWALAPVFQLGLVAGLWGALTGWKRPGALAVSLVVLALGQILAQWAFVSYVGSTGSAPHTLVVRAWSLALPMVIAAGVWWMAALKGGPAFVGGPTGVAQTPGES